MKALTTQRQEIANIKQEFQKYFLEHSPENISSSSKIKTVRDVLTNWTPTLTNLKNVYGKEWVVNYIAAWLVHLNENSNVRTKMTPFQMDFTAERIYDTYSLRIADLTLFFREVKEGVYGGFYENLSNEKIMEWIAIYYDKRCEMAQMVSSTSHTEFSSKIDKINPEVFKQMFKGVGEKQIDHRLKKFNGLGTRFKKRMEENQEKWIDSLKMKVKDYTKEELEETIKTWSVRNDLNIYVSILENELKEREKAKT